MLKPGGVVRIIVPSARAISSFYLNNINSCDPHISEFAQEYNLEYQYPVDILKLAFHDFGHSTGSIIDSCLLVDLLYRSGFDSVTETLLGKPDNLDFTGVDNRTSWFDRHFSLCLEASKF